MNNFVVFFFQKISIKCTALMFQCPPSCIHKVECAAAWCHIIKPIFTVIVEQCGTHTHTHAHTGSSYHNTAKYAHIKRNKIPLGFIY